MATGVRNDPFRTFNFVVEIDNIPVAGFSEVSGLTADGDSVDYREGTDKDNTVRKLPGLRKYGNVTLKRGYTRNNTLWLWYKDVLEGKGDIRRLVTITLLDESRKAVLRWQLESAWINKIEGPGFKASGNEIAIESCDLVHEGLTIELA